MTRVGAIDCGTNSIRLLIADVSDGQLHDVHREMRIVRLGQGVDATGYFAPDAIARTQAALTGYAQLLKTHGVSRVRMVATSATRDAGNRDDFFSMTAEILGGVVPDAPSTSAEVISGDEEARLSFIGAVGELDSAEAPFVVVDLGGGSTEVVLGDQDGVEAAFSADIGCVRLTERCLHSDPPTPTEVAAARDVVRERLGQALRVVPVDRAHTWVGVTRKQRAALGPMHEGRVDVIGGGAIVVEELAHALGARAGIDQLMVSEHDILDGIALSIADAG